MFPTIAKRIRNPQMTKATVLNEMLKAWARARAIQKVKVWGR